MIDVNPLAHSFYLREIEGLARRPGRALSRWSLTAAALACLLACEVAALGLLG